MKFLTRAGFVLSLALLGAALGGAGMQDGEAVIMGLLGGALLGLTLPRVIRDIIRKP